MNSTEILVAAQAHVTEASRQLGTSGALYQDVQAALEQCGHTLAAIARPVVQGEPAVAAHAGGESGGGAGPLPTQQDAPVL